MNCYVFLGGVHILEEICERPYRNSSSTSQSFKQRAIPMNEFQDAFDLLKEKLCSSVTLKLPQRVGRFSVTCDASDFTVGYYLERADRSRLKRPVAFGGRKLHKAGMNYSTTEKECLAVVEALIAYRPYLLGNQSVNFSSRLSIFMDGIIQCRIPCVGFEMWQHENHPGI